MEASRSFPGLVQSVAFPIRLLDMKPVGRSFSRAPVSRSEPKIHVHSTKARFVVITPWDADRDS